MTLLILSQVEQEKTEQRLDICFLNENKSIHLGTTLGQAIFEIVLGNDYLLKFEL